MGSIRLDFNDMARVGQFVLLALFVVASWRRKEHRPLAFWLAVSCAYVLLNKLYITPVLSHLPRPYHGLPRVMMHLGQALFIGAGAAATAAMFTAFNVPSRWLPAPFFVVFCAMFLLVDGYSGANLPGIYRIGGLEFGSNAVYTFTSLVLAVIAWAFVLPRASRAFFESRDEHQVVMRVVLLMELVAGSLRIAIPRVWGATGALRAHVAVEIVVYSVAIGLYAALLLNGLQRVWTDTLAERFVRLRRYGTMKRIQSRLAHARLLARGHVEDGSVPYFTELAQRAGRQNEAERVVLTDAALATSIDLVAAVAGTMHGPDARVVLAHAGEMLDGAAPWGDAWPIEWERLLVSQQEVMRRQRLLGPITLVVLSALQGVPLGTARSAIARTLSLLGADADDRDGAAAPARGY